GADVFLRELALVRNIEYTSKESFETVDSFAENFRIVRLSELWGKYKQTNDRSRNDREMNDRLILINIVEDAYIAAQKAPVNIAPVGEERKRSVLDTFHKSELVNLLGRLKGKPP